MKVLLCKSPIVRTTVQEWPVNYWLRSSRNRLWPQPPTLSGSLSTPPCRRVHDAVHVNSSDVVLIEEWCCTSWQVIRHWQFAIWCWRPELCCGFSTELMFFGVDLYQSLTVRYRLSLQVWPEGLVRIYRRKKVALLPRKLAALSSVTGRPSGHSCINIWSELRIHLYCLCL